MADEPDQYLRCALECARLSQTLPDATARDTFAAMAKVWVHLAAETRKRQSKLDDGSGSYRDADRSRRPAVKVDNYQRQGAGQMDKRFL